MAHFVYILQSETDGSYYVGSTRDLAQDFHEAFALGEDHRSINSIDSDGVALAAIQGLYALVKEKDAENAELRREVSDLSARITALEKLVSGRKGGIY